MVSGHTRQTSVELLDLASDAATLGDVKQARNDAARAAERRERKEESECECEISKRSHIS